MTPDSPIGSVGTLQAHLFARVPERRNYVAALGAFALIAALLAAIGLYGIMAYDVNARSGEIAVRKALGARRRDIIAAIGRPAAAIVGLGLAAGFAGALAVPRLLGGQLWGIAPFDPANIRRRVGGTAGPGARQLRHPAASCADAGCWPAACGASESGLPDNSQLLNSTTPNQRPTPNAQNFQAKR